MISFDEIVKKVKKMQDEGEVDLSRDEDLSLAVMNLISIEEHLFMSIQRTGKDFYADTMKEVREQRKFLMKKLLPNTEGESWCISKHLLATTMRLIEVGTKLQAEGKNDEAKDVFDRAYKMYSLFWAIKIQVVDVNDVKELAEQDTKENAWTLNDIVNKLVNCCDE